MVDVDKCKMTYYPHPVLLEPAKPVETIDDSIRRLADRMIDIMMERQGVGLAGPQAGVNLRIFVISLDGSRENARVYINPAIEPVGQMESHEEGCLSIPGVYAKIKRYNRCRVKATGLDGKEFTDEAEGLYARALQHENDHLEGMMIKDRMSQVGRIAARKQLRKLQEDYEAEKE